MKLLRMLGPVLVIVGMLPIALAWACLYVGGLIMALADRLAPVGTWGNCWSFALAEWHRRHRAWVAAGMLAGQEPQLTMRWSRLEPRPLLHVKVSTLPEAAEVSFVPVDDGAVPAWAVWRWIGFRGRVVSNDNP